MVQVPVLSDTFVSLPWELKAGSMIQIHPVFFNIGIGLWNQSVTGRYTHTQAFRGKATSILLNFDQF